MFYHLQLLIGMKIALLQTALSWENPSKNRLHFSNLLSQIPNETDIAVLPEMFSTGFSHSTRFSESMEGETVAWMKTIAQQLNVAITGSMMIQENKHFYNRLIWIEPSGKVLTYDKKHLFTYTGEDTIFTHGKDVLIISYKGWRIRPFICYDLRFPVWLRNTKPHYDLLLGVANWPAKRIEVWDTLLKARAIENQCYCIGCNIVGVDGNNILYNGHSAGYNCKGETLSRITDQPATIAIDLDKESIEKARKTFPVLDDADDFSLL